MPELSVRSAPAKAIVALQVAAHGIPLALIALGLADAAALLLMYAWEMLGIGLCGIVIALLDRGWKWQERLRHISCIALLCVASAGAALQFLDYHPELEVTAPPALWFAIFVILVTTLLDLHRLRTAGATVLTRDDFETLFMIATMGKPLLVILGYLFGYGAGTALFGGSQAGAVGGVVMRVVLDLGHDRVQRRFGL